MKDFFLDKFKLEYRTNELMVSAITEQEEYVSERVLSIFSHILNMHHIWLANLQARKAESFSWDMLPLTFWSALNRQNYLETIRFIEETDDELLFSKHPSVSSELPYTSSDVLFNILQHSAYHRGQLIHELKKDKLPIPLLQWMLIE